MKKLTRFKYLSGGISYAGCMQGFLSRSQIQCALVASGRGCSQVLALEYVEVRL